MLSSVNEKDVMFMMFITSQRGAKKKIQVSDRIRTHDLPRTARML